MNQIALTSLEEQPSEVTGLSINDNWNPQIQRFIIKNYGLQAALAVAGIIMVSGITGIPLSKHQDASVSHLIDISSSRLPELRIEMDILDWDLHIRKQPFIEPRKMAVKLNYIGKRKPNFEI